MVAMNERFEMRMDEEAMQRLDEWRRKQDDVPPRAVAVRRLMDQALDHPENASLRVGDRLILSMLCDITKALKLKTDLDPQFIQSVMFGGHYWALSWQLQGLLHDHVDKPANVRFVVDVLDMWDLIEWGYGELTAAEKAELEKEAGSLGKKVTFPGFDGNNESELLGIGRFMTREMGRFERFKKRELNSHAQLAGSYRRMLAVFEPMRAKLSGRSMTAAEIAKVLLAMVHPDNRKK